MSEFLHAIQTFSKLPFFTDRDGAFQGLVWSYATSIPLVGEVCAGDCTFEEVVEPLVEANLRIRFPYFHSDACSSEEFAQMAWRVSMRMSRVISLEHIAYAGRYTYRVGLTEQVSYPWLRSILIFLAPVAVAIVTFLAFSQDYLMSGGSTLSFDLATAMTFLAVGAGFGVILVAIQFMGIVDRFHRRRAFARQVRDEAQYLDRAMAQIRQD